MKIIGSCNHCLVDKVYVFWSVKMRYWYCEVCIEQIIKWDSAVVNRENNESDSKLSDFF